MRAKARGGLLFGRFLDHVLRHRLGLAGRLVLGEVELLLDIRGECRIGDRRRLGNSQFLADVARQVLVIGRSLPSLGVQEDEVPEIGQEVRRRPGQEPRHVIEVHFFGTARRVGSGDSHERRRAQGSGHECVLASRWGNR